MNCKIKIIVISVLIGFTAILLMAGGIVYFGYKHIIVLNMNDLNLYRYSRYYIPATSVQIYESRREIYGESSLFNVLLYKNIIQIQEREETRWVDLSSKIPFSSAMVSPLGQYLLDGDWWVSWIEENQNVAGIVWSDIVKLLRDTTRDNTKYVEEILATVEYGITKEEYISFAQKLERKYQQ